MRQLNPVETANFVAKMNVLPAEDQADVALKWRERTINVLAAYNPTAAGYAGRVVTAGTFTGLLGWRDGVNDAERAKLVQVWQATAPGMGIDTTKYPTPFQTVVDANGAVVHQAVKDPNRLWVLPKSLWWTLGLAGVNGILGMTDRGQLATPYLHAATFAGVGYVIGASVREYTATRAAAAGGQVLAMNPSGGFRRAA